MTAPIVAVPHLNRVRKRCRTISYTITVVTVCKERVKRSVPGTRRRRFARGTATYGPWCPETGRMARIIKKKLGGPLALRLCRLVDERDVIGRQDLHDLGVVRGDPVVERLLPVL